MKKSINQIKKLQMQKITEWEKDHVNWKDNQVLVDKWYKMCDSTMDGSTEKEIATNDKKIQKLIGEMTSIYDGVVDTNTDTNTQTNTNTNINTII